MQSPAASAPQDPIVALGRARPAHQLGRRDLADALHLESGCGGGGGGLTFTLGQSLNVAKHANGTLAHQPPALAPPFGSRPNHEAQANGATESTFSAISFACDDAPLSFMDIRSEDLNFSDIGDVWLVKSWQEILIRVAFVVPIVLLGLLGNATVIYSIGRSKSFRSKPTNVFILNMALADLLTTLVCPNAALLTDIYQFYVLGAFVCRMEGFVKITCLLVSAYSLIVLSFDWFLSVVRPCRKRMGVRKSWIAFAIIWLVASGMALPLWFSRRLRERHWRDLVEVWCCEMIQYTKYYWVCITLFLIYLPTFVMTIVLVVILAQMDKFEARLRRSRGASSAATAASLSANSRARLSIVQLDSLNNFASGSAHSTGQETIQASSSAWLTKATTTTTTTTTSNSTARRAGDDLSSHCHASSVASRNGSSLSISMKYRRRIVKILFFYLLTSIVCWTPLQFTIVYRHFRSEAVPARWFFELTFFAQLCASLSAAMNPIIFGFLSQPFRRLIVSSFMFRLLDKIWTRNRARGGGHANGACGQAGAAAAPNQLAAKQQPGRQVREVNVAHAFGCSAGLRDLQRTTPQPGCNEHRRAAFCSASKASLVSVRRATATTAATVASAKPESHRPRSRSTASQQQGSSWQRQQQRLEVRAGQHHCKTVERVVRRSHSSKMTGGHCQPSRADRVKRVSFKHPNGQLGAAALENAAFEGDNKDEDGAKCGRLAADERKQPRGRLSRNERGEAITSFITLPKN